MARSILLVFGGPTAAEMEEEVMRWYEPHLEQLCSLPGIISGQLLRPSNAQQPRTTAKLPQTLGLYEYDTDDLAGAVDATWASHLEGVRRGVFEAGRSIPPPADGVFALDPQYQSAYYDLVWQWPRATERRVTARTIFLVFGSPATAEMEEEAMRWYEPHLEQMCSLPGIISSQLLRPSSVQFPRTTAKLPQTLGLYEYDTDDVAGAVEATWASHLEGVRRGVFEAGRSIPPPADGVFALDRQYQSAYYDLVSSFPRVK